MKIILFLLFNFTLGAIKVADYCTTVKDWDNAFEMGAKRYYKKSLDYYQEESDKQEDELVDESNGLQATSAYSFATLNSGKDIHPVIYCKAGTCNKNDNPLSAMKCKTFPKTLLEGDDKFVKNLLENTKKYQTFTGKLPLPASNFIPKYLGCNFVEYSGDPALLDTKRDMDDWYVSDKMLNPNSNEESYENGDIGDGNTEEEEDEGMMDPSLMQTGTNSNANSKNQPGTTTTAQKPNLGQFMFFYEPMSIFAAEWDNLRNQCHPTSEVWVRIKPWERVNIYLQLIKFIKVFHAAGYVFNGIDSEGLGFLHRNNRPVFVDLQKFQPVNTPLDKNFNLPIYYYRKTKYLRAFKPTAKMPNPPTYKMELSDDAYALAKLIIELEIWTIQDAHEDLAVHAEKPNDQALLVLWQEAQQMRFDAVKSYFDEMSTSNPAYEDDKAEWDQEKNFMAAILKLMTGMLGLTLANAESTEPAKRFTYNQKWGTMDQLETGLNDIFKKLSRTKSLKTGPCIEEGKLARSLAKISAESIEVSHTQTSISIEQSLDMFPERRQVSTTHPLGPHVLSMWPRIWLHTGWSQGHHVYLVPPGFYHVRKTAHVNVEQTSVEIQKVQVDLHQNREII